MLAIPHPSGAELGKLCQNATQTTEQAGKQPPAQAVLKQRDPPNFSSKSTTNFVMTTWGCVSERNCPGE